jgi:hypothetical protein
VAIGFGVAVFGEAIDVPFTTRREAKAFSFCGWLVQSCIGDVTTTITMSQTLERITLPLPVYCAGPGEALPGTSAPPTVPVVAAAAAVQADDGGGGGSSSGAVVAAANASGNAIFTPKQKASSAADDGWVEDAWDEEVLVEDEVEAGGSRVRSGSGGGGGGASGSAVDTAADGEWEEEEEQAAADDEAWDEDEMEEDVGESAAFSQQPDQPMDDLAAGGDGDVNGDGDGDGDSEGGGWDVVDEAGDGGGGGVGKASTGAAAGFTDAADPIRQRFSAASKLRASAWVVNCAREHLHRTRSSQTETLRGLLKVLTAASAGASLALNPCFLFWFLDFCFRVFLFFVFWGFCFGFLIWICFAPLFLEWFLPNVLVLTPNIFSLSFFQKGASDYVILQAAGSPSQPGAPSSWFTIPIR